MNLVPNCSRVNLGCVPCFRSRPPFQTECVPGNYKWHIPSPTQLDLMQERSLCFTRTGERPREEMVYYFVVTYLCL